MHMNTCLGQVTRIKACDGYINQCIRHVTRMNESCIDARPHTYVREGQITHRISRVMSHI